MLLFLLWLQKGPCKIFLDTKSGGGGYFIYQPPSLPPAPQPLQLSQANSQLTIETEYQERLSIAASHILLLILRKSSTVPIANFLTGLCTNRVTVYIIFSLPKPLYTALIASAKDNSPTSNSHSTKTVLSIDVYLNLDDC